MERNKVTSWRDGKTTSERGYGHRWQQARQSFLREFPLCEMCTAKGRVTLAQVVDHRIPHKGDQSLFWDRSNWSPLCKSHHDNDKSAIETGRPIKPTIGLDGYPVE